MLKILSTNQIKELDRATIFKQGITSVELMERAATEVVNWITERYETGSTFKVFCGPGNNGGDGLAIARLLLKRKYKAQVYVLNSEKTTTDFKINLERLSSICTINYVTTIKDLSVLFPNDLIIDAIFGSGLNKEVEGLYAQVIDVINSSNATVIAVDIASGLFADRPQERKCIIKPTYTLSFQLPKLAFMAPENGEYVGEWYLLDIGLDPEYIKEAETTYYYLDEGYAKATVKPRKKFSHKNSYGKALIIAGQYGMIGAAVLASKACLKNGAGLCVTYIPKCGYGILQLAVPENMCVVDENFEFITDIPDISSFTAIGIGPGIGQAEETKDALVKLFTTATIPLVIDADALNIIGSDKSLLEIIPKGSVLTPHQGELTRLVGKAENHFERLEQIKALAKIIEGAVILKGAHTAIATPEGVVYFNSTGNPGMATAGSGDVLTGIITSLIAQGYNTIDAAKLGVYIHGAAGDFAAERLTEHCVSATDIINNIPKFYKSIY